MPSEGCSAVCAGLPPLMSIVRFQMTDQPPLDRTMYCPIHGYRRVTFICQHLQCGLRIGFFEPDGQTVATQEKNAWCVECDDALRKEGEWNDRTEELAGIMAICEGCFEVIRQRNS